MSDKQQLPIQPDLPLQPNLPDVVPGEKPSEEIPIPDIMRQKLTLMIEHNRYSNTMVFKNTALLNMVTTQDVWYESITELHKKSLDKLKSVISHREGVRLSRTNHGQLAALVVRYDASPEAIASCQEALLLERVAEEMSQALAEERGRGNVHFIKAKGKSAV